MHEGEAFWIQTRVLKWAGYPDIRTVEEYFELIEQYMEANPLMENGTPNIPYTILCDDWRYFCLENPPQFLAGQIRSPGFGVTADIGSPHSRIGPVVRI